MTVALALVPEAVAFAFVAGVEPLVGLYAAFIVGLITAIFGGRPGMISGATGALAVVMVALVATHGLEYLLASVVLMGLIQITLGVLRMGKFIRMVPHPVMLGFVNGLAIVIFLAQLEQFRIVGPEGHHVWMSGLTLWLTLGLVAGTMAIIWVMPKITKALPAPLVAIGLVATIVILMDLPVPRVGDLASLAGGLPTFHIPMVPLNFETLQIILPYAVILALIGLIESLLTLNLIGEITGERGRCQPRMYRPRCRKYGYGIFWRHGRLCYDRAIDDQREIRRTNANVGCFSRFIFTCVHPFCQQPD